MNPINPFPPSQSAAPVARSIRPDPSAFAWKWRTGVATSTLLALSALANGGPFVLKYPGGDPAAKGVLARLDPGLQPAREARLQVIEENLSIRFEPDVHPFFRGREGDLPSPLVAVAAEYFITNTTSESVEVDFGFPILRGIYINPLSMMPMPDAQVHVDGTHYLRPALISNSAIYGILRRNAVEIIGQQLRADPKLDQLFHGVKSASPESRGAAREVLAVYLTSKKKWPATDAALLAEYAALQPGDNPTTAEQSPEGSSARMVRHGFVWWDNDAALAAARNEMAWAVNAIGEQKATQWLTRLAGLLDSASTASYEAIFQSWGGDVRERSADLVSGQVRPREVPFGKRHTARGLPRRDAVTRRSDRVCSRGLFHQRRESYG